MTRTRDFNKQINQFKKMGQGQLSPEQIARLTLQLDYVIQFKNRLPDNEGYQLARIKLNALVNSCCRAVPEVAQQLNITVPDVYSIVNHDWASIAGSERKFAQPDLLNHYKDDINRLDAEYVTLVKNTVNTLVHPDVEYHGSLKNINKEVNQYRLALQHIKNSPQWCDAYQIQLEQFNSFARKLNAIVQTCQGKYNHLIQRQKELKSNYDAELNKINNYQCSFIELLSVEESTLENKTNELSRTYESSLQIIKAKKQELKIVMEDVENRIKGLPTEEIFKQAVVNTIEAEMIRLAGKDGEKDQIFEKIGGDIFNSKAELLKELEMLSEQFIPKEVKQHVDELMLKNQVENIEKHLVILHGTGLDEATKPQYRTLIKSIADNNDMLSDIIRAMNEISVSIQQIKQQDIPAGSPLDNKKEVPLDALVIMASPGSPKMHALESNQNLQQLDEHPAFYEKASALINTRNNEISQLQRRYESLSNQYQTLKANNEALFEKLQSIEGNLQDKASSITLLNKKSATVRKNSYTEIEFVAGALSQLNSPKEEAKQALIELANNKNKFIASVKHDKSFIIDVNGNPISDLPTDLEKDAMKSLNFLEESAEKLLAPRLEQAGVCVYRAQQLQASVEKKQKDRQEKLNKIPVTFQQYVSENKNKTFDECMLDYEQQLNEIEKEFSIERINQRKDNRESAITQLKKNFNVTITETKRSGEDLRRLNDGKNQLMTTLREQVTKLDRTVKATVGGTIGGSVGGALLGAITGFVVGGGPIGAIVGLFAGFVLGGCLGGGAGFLFGHKLPLRSSLHSFAVTSTQPIMESDYNDNADEIGINNLFFNSKITVNNPGKILETTIPSVKSDGNKDELSSIKTMDDFDDYVFGKGHDFKRNNTTNKSKASSFWGRIFNRITTPVNSSVSVVSLNANNSLKNS